MPRVVFACRPVADKQAPCAHVSMHRQKLGGRMCDVVQVLCELDHSKMTRQSTDHPCVVVCECCIVKVEGVPDFTKLKSGQTMRKVDGEWITTIGQG